MVLGGVAATLAILLLALLLVREMSQRAAVRTSLMWARLEPVPASAGDWRVETTGGFFSRGFLVEFSAPKADIVAWLNASEGTTSALLAPDGVGQTISIVPGAGAQFAAVEIVWPRGRVRIRTYWS